MLQKDPKNCGQNFNRLHPTLTKKKDQNQKFLVVLIQK